VYIALAIYGHSTSSFYVGLGSHSGAYEEFYILEYNTVQSVESQQKLHVAVYSACYLHSNGFLLCLFFGPEDVPPKRPFAFNGLQDIISQEIEPFFVL
jgi:hypothetical protein